MYRHNGDIQQEKKTATQTYILIYMYIHYIINKYNIWNTLNCFPDEIVEHYLKLLVAISGIINELHFIFSIII